MRHPAEFQPAVVIYASERSYAHGAPGGAGQESGPMFRASAILDPHKIAVEEPVRWAAFINARYPRHDGSVQRDFGVCEKTERLWRAGDRAPRSHHRTVAERLHPDDLRAYMHGGDVVSGRYRKP